MEMLPMKGKLIHVQFLLLVIAFLVLEPSESDTIVEDSAHRRLLASEKEDNTVPCPSGWVISPSKSKCFRYTEISQSWNTSETLCKGYGGHLAALASSQDLTFAQDLCKLVTGCWVGGRGFNSTVGVGWKWSDNTLQWNDSISYGASLLSNCSTRSCHTNSSVDSCTLVMKGLTSLMSERCNKSHDFICMLDLENKCYHMRCHREYLIILAVVGGLILCTTLTVIIWLLAFKGSKKRRKSRKLSNPAASALVPPSWKVFNKEELKSIKRNYSDGDRLLGDAKTGSTYSGALPDGSRVVVKRLMRSSFQRKKEFYSEIGKVARLHHPNLVAVKGCCYDHGDRYIVYEFIINGPLDRWLHHIPRGGRSLDWAMRMKIAITLAQGIEYK